jgi:hypothetical protein
VTETERSKVIAAAALGTALGAAVGFLFLTDAGARFRLQLEPRLDDVIDEVRRLRHTIEKARLATSESWRSLSELIGEPPSGSRWEGGRRTSSR